VLFALVVTELVESVECLLTAADKAKKRRREVLFDVAIEISVAGEGAVAARVEADETVLSGGREEAYLR
jgi:hypothetical protein